MEQEDLGPSGGGTEQGGGENSQGSMDSRRQDSVPGTPALRGNGSKGLRISGATSPRDLCPGRDPLEGDILIVEIEIRWTLGHLLGPPGIGVQGSVESLLSFPEVKLLDCTLNLCLIFRNH